TVLRALSSVSASPNDNRTFTCPRIPSLSNFDLTPRDVGHNQQPQDTSHGAFPREADSWFTPETATHLRHSRQNRHSFARARRSRLLRTMGQGIQVRASLSRNRTDRLTSSLGARPTGGTPIARTRRDPRSSRLQRRLCG